MDVKFYRCKHCGQIVAVVKATGVPIVCCGEPMTELVAGEVDAALEKHVPVYEVNDGVVSVKVGSVEHPMLPEHYIQWIAVQSGDSVQIKWLQPETKPEATFYIAKDAKVDAVYEYCNLHGLWKA
ncbi:MAG: desulfoferrodoxin FeS4 iron-binding domain-containing protein [Lachnospiraceae bacterium]|nr:desulfoferrodoxin FeS4 iron-binding domain-containing protein [Lachnospiraceae bacterium]